MTQQAYHSQFSAQPHNPATYRAPLVRVTPKKWTPGEPIPPKGVLEPDAHGALARHCAGCDSRDRLNRAVAVELDRGLAENRVLREELERAA